MSTVTGPGTTRPGITVALDGPASSGKSSVGAAAAARLGMRFVDTGLLYRALTALALRDGIATDDAARLVPLATRMALADDGSGRLTRVLLDGEDASAAVHNAEVDASVSAVAQVPEVRAALLATQRAMAADGGIILAGRDIGTVVLPDAPLKIYLDASVDERARRRIAERGLDPDGEEAEIVRASLRARDAQDSGRAVAPLTVADDALVILTDGHDFDGSVDLVVAAIVAADASLRPQVRQGGGSRTRKAATAAAGARATRTSRTGKDEATREPANPAAAATDAAASDPGATLPVTATEAPIGAAAAAPREAAAAPDGQPAAASARRAPRSGRTAVSEAGPEKPNRIIEAALRLDNARTPMTRGVAMLARLAGRVLAETHVEGLERIPKRGPVLLAINHISNLDPIYGGAWANEAIGRRRIHWLGKRELFDWPVFGWACAHGGVHPVDRGTADVEAFRLATRILEKGYVLLVFPEGTRSPTGELQEAKDGLAMLAMRTGAQIVPIGINNTDAIWPKGHKLPMPFPRRRVVVRVGEPFRIEDVIPPGTDRKQAKTVATRAIMGRIAELLDPRHRGFYADAIRTPELSEP